MRTTWPGSWEGTALGFEVFSSGSLKGLGFRVSSLRGSSLFGFGFGSVWIYTSGVWGLGG